MSIQIAKDASLTEKQQLAYNSFIRGDNIFITGEAGTGKTFLIRYFMLSKRRHLNIGFTSTTGISAILIGGSTVHSFLGLGIGTASTRDLAHKILRRPYMRTRWRNLETLIIDEISMLSPELFVKIDELARILRKWDEPFGGIQLILTGDFLQIYPVKAEKYCFQTPSWEECDFKVFYLTENIRQEHDTVFQDCLSKLRMGVVDDFVVNHLTARQNLSRKHLEIKPTYLLPLKRQANSYNQKKFQKLVKKMQKDNIREYTQELTLLDRSIEPRIYMYLKNLKVPEQLFLAIGAQVILLANLDTSEGFANGSRGVVTGFQIGSSYPTVKFMNNKEIVIEPFVFEIEERGNLLFTVTQIPLMLGYALTIHSAQGCTLDCAVINTSHIFEYGQAYVACSRVRNISNLYFKGNVDFDRIMAHPDAIQFYKNLENKDSSLTLTSPESLNDAA
ncbi:AAA family ATPase [bacterium]|nr:AAA family ATPase [bacterium]